MKPRTVSNDLGTGKDDFFSSELERSLKSDDSVVQPDGGVQTSFDKLEDSLGTDEDYDPYADTDFEIDDNLDLADPDPAIIAQSQQNEVLKGLASAVENLANVNKPKPPEVVKKERAKGEPVDMKKLQEDFNKELHETEDPFSLVERTAKNLVGPQMAELSIRLQKLQKQTLAADPKYKHVFDNYDVEVENIIASLPPDQQTHPDAYEYAAKQVLVTHIDEIGEALYSNRQQTPEEAKIVKTRMGRSAMVSNVQGVNTTQQSAAPKRKKVTRREVEIAKRMGVSINDYLLSKEGN